VEATAQGALQATLRLQVSGIYCGETGPAAETQPGRLRSGALHCVRAKDFRYRCVKAQPRRSGVQPAGADGEGDDTLMARVVARDRAAFRLLANRHGERIYRIAWRMTQNATEAEDVAQDSLLKLWSQTGWTPGQGGVGAWLARVATNACLDRLRKNRFRSDEEVPERADDAPLADAMLAQNDEAQRARDAIAALPDTQRAAIVLTYYEDLPNRDAAKAMDLNIKAFESLLFRARSALKQALSGLREEAA
jgi:RNA polymerase sigma factor (sigma-70 family)